MRVKGLGRIKRAATRMWNRIAPGIVILLYHRVTTLERDPQLLAVSPANFDEQMAMLKREWEVISLTEAVEAVNSGRLPRRAVVVTFDDGYEDNFTNGLPILEKHQAAATVFVSSGFVGSEQEFFWDELDRLALGEEKAGSWNVLQQAEATRGQRRYTKLCARVSWMAHEARCTVLERVRADVAMTVEGRRTHRAMSGGMLKQLAASSLIDIGGHTVFHPRLAALSENRQRDEIVRGKMELEALLGKKVTSFSYPFGGHADYSAETIRLVREAGVWVCVFEFWRVGSSRRGFVSVESATGA